MKRKIGLLVMVGLMVGVGCGEDTPTGPDKPKGPIPRYKYSEPTGVWGHVYCEDLWRDVGGGRYLTVSNDCCEIAAYYHHGSDCF